LICVLPDGFIVLLRPAAALPASLLMPVPVPVVVPGVPAGAPPTEDPALVPPPAVPAALPPAPLLPPACASAKVLVSAIAVASPIVASFMTAPFSASYGGATRARPDTFRNRDHGCLLFPRVSLPETSDRDARHGCMTAVDATGDTMDKNNQG
jgi:hypothetical protein